VGNNRDAGNYLFECMRYMELNPLRAGMRLIHVSALGRVIYAEGKADVLIGAHSPYRRLGREEGGHQAACRALVKGPLDAQTVEWIRECTNKGWTPGSGRFQSKAERLAERRATPLPKGRPKKNRQN
jgi:putative transposase